MKTVPDYEQDGLKSLHNNEFMANDKFISAYNRGVQAAGTDYNWHWRVYIGLWAAKHCYHYEGDYVECGVNAGFMSSAIMHYLDWDGVDRKFYLLDTFSGIDPKYISDNEREDGILKKNEELLESGFYINNTDKVRKNFSEWTNCKIIVGSIPDTLVQIKSNKVAFVHIDMNCAPPEIEAIRYLWPKLVDGGIVLLDDYAYVGYHHQKKAMDKFANSIGVEIVSLPTGQGLLIKNGKPALNKCWCCNVIHRVKGFLSKWSNND